jgi:branched-chain amino acid transport system ATP-binding protein
VVNVIKRFGGLLALNSVSLEIDAGRVTLLIGPNGSGKTTLINVISGVHKVDSGKIYLQQEEITNIPPNEIFKRGIVRTFQKPEIFANLSVIDNVILGRFPIKGESITKAIFRLWKKEEKELEDKAYSLLKKFNISHLWDRPARELSGGQLKLLELSRALMSDPKVLLMDEPIAGVSMNLAREFLDLIKGLKNGIAILLVEHRLDIASEYADYVYAMANGRIISEGSVNKVLTDSIVIDSYLG